MMYLGYNNRWLRLAKDLIFVALAFWLLSTRRPIAVLVALLGGYWYARDAYYQAKALWQEKHYKAPETETSAPKGDGKITVTDLSDAKEVHYEKE